MGTTRSVVLLVLLLALSCASTPPPAPPPGPSSPPGVCAARNGGGTVPVWVVLGEALLFCGLSVGTNSCCTVLDDFALAGQYAALLLNGSAHGCALLTIRDMLCSRCLPSSDPGAPGTPPLGELVCTSPPPPPSSAAAHTPGGALAGDLCLERITAGSYHGFTPYPADLYSDPGSRNKAFIWTRDARIWAVSVPARGRGALLVGGRPFLDLADRVYYDAARGLGLMGVALHPKFTTTGRLFVSYACDSFASPACTGGTAATAPTPPTRPPCRYLLVVAEFAVARDGATDDYSKATRANPSQVRRLFNACMPDAESSSEQQHAGQLLFRSGDHFMYLILGTGGGQEAKGSHDGGQLDFSSQNKSGEIIRLDVGGTAATGQGSGNGSMEAEVFARAMGVLRGCSVDAGMPYYFYCTGVDQQYDEQVYLISDKPAGSYNGGKPAATVSIIINHRRPPTSPPSSIVAGLVYQGLADPSLRGRYLYMYGSAAWAAKEKPGSSGRYVTTRIPNLRCSRSSPVPCSAGGVDGGRVVSIAEGSYYTNDAFLLATDGVYRLVPPGLCDTAPPSPPPPKLFPRKIWLLVVVLSIIVLVVFAMIFACVCCYYRRRGS